MKVLLISGGDIDILWATEFVASHKYDKIIAVDGGLSAANLLNVTPDIVLGDFDTVSNKLIDEYKSKNIGEVIKLNPMKDDTDTQYAINKAIDMGAKEIHIIGGNGGRIDHSLSNIFMLKLAYEKGVKAYMYDSLNKIYVISGDVVLKKDLYYCKYISFIQLEGPALNVTLKGFKYNVEKFDFDTNKEYRIGVSNEFDSDEAHVSIDKGMFIVVEVSDNEKKIRE